MTKKILIIEDRLNGLDDISRLLESKGYNIEFVVSDDAAINRIIQSKPDLILIDLAVSNRAKIEICGQIRNHISLSKLPIIVYGPKDSLEDIVAAYNLGADYYINREDEGEELLITLIEVVFTRQKYRENFTYREFGQPTSWYW